MDPLSMVRMLQAGGGASGGLSSLDQVGRAAPMISDKDLAQLKSIAPPTEAQTVSPAFAPGQTGASSFADTFGTLVREVNEKQLVSREAVNGLMSGENIPLHQAMIAMEEASVSFQLMVEVRNKLLDSYQELMRMQV